MPRDGDAGARARASARSTPSSATPTSTASAAPRSGCAKAIEPYPGADDDARAIDTRLGVAEPDRAALRSRDPRASARRRRSSASSCVISRTASPTTSLWHDDRRRGRRARGRREARRHELARGYQRIDVAEADGRRACTSIAFLDVAARRSGTALRQDDAPPARSGARVDRRRSSTATRSRSPRPSTAGSTSSTLLGLSGGMPTLVSVQSDRLDEALGAARRAALGDRLAALTLTRRVKRVSDAQSLSETCLSRHGKVVDPRRSAA